MSLNKLIKERRSIRKYTDLPVSQELVFKLLQKAEELCPYEGEVGWRYVYAGSLAERERLADYMSEKITDNKLAKLAMGVFMQAFRNRIIKVPANVIAIARTDSDPVKNEETFGTLCRILQNFQLLAWEQGLGMVWITEPIIQNESFYNRIGLQANERFVGIMQMGYYDKAPKGHARTPAERYWTDYAGMVGGIKR